MDVEIIDTLELVSATEWNALVDDDFPFARHEFLIAMERHHCVGENMGWLPCHVVIKDKGNLLAAMPLYHKTNSYGELVFDWSWADAYQRHGLAYYPKLVCAIPYTPATGPRLLVHPQHDDKKLSRLLIDSALYFAQTKHYSSFHLLFPGEKDRQFLQQQDALFMRMGCQFHWHNNDYRDFDHFLSYFNSKKRKQVKRERRSVQEQDIEIELLDGHHATDEHWRIFAHYYTSIFDRKYGMPTFNYDFFKEIGRTMPDNILLVMAKKHHHYVAGAFCMRGNQTLYGRHWGCDDYHHNLHFELCYYQGLEYCIKHGLKKFDPGAQGEHKVARGFLPTATWSAHWIAHPQFADAIARHVEQENEGVQNYMQSLQEHSPFKIEQAS